MGYLSSRSRNVRSAVFLKVQDSTHPSESASVRAANEECEKNSDDFWNLT